ncbi:hypothetical protein IKF33_00475 [Candidatus Saccharibacteria bacterium]|nr:hypothetical protein [Candidatus Saccharibacteria bacterium]
MKEIDKKYLDNYGGDDFVWYACYGSNINRDRLMCYINGDKSGKYSSATGCVDKKRPAEERKYIFNHPIYFAGVSKKWGGGGMAFLDYKNKGKSYGKIYKIKTSQFKDILKQEQSCKLYNAILLVDEIDGLPVFSFTSKYKLENELNPPSDEYVRVIKEGLLDLYKTDFEQTKEYFED